MKREEKSGGSLALSYGIFGTFLGGLTGFLLAYAGMISTGFIPAIAGIIGIVAYCEGKSHQSRESSNIDIPPNLESESLDNARSRRKNDLNITVTKHDTGHFSPLGKILFDESVKKQIKYRDIHDD